MPSHPLKYLILSAYDVGGASIAAIRLHMGLLQLGVDSRLLTLHTSASSIPQHFTYSPSSSFRKRMGLKWRKRQEHKQKTSLHLPKEESLSGEFSMPVAPFDITESEHWAWADVVNLHWVNEWIQLENLLARAGNKPLIWTMHDMHAFTGGCHYSHGCTGMQGECHACPMLKNSNLPELAHQFWKSKKAAMVQFPPKLTITAPSAWMVNWSKQSSLFRQLDHRAIPNSLDTRIFRPISKEVCRESLGLDRHKKILLCVVQSLKDHRKGFHYLLNSLPFFPDPENWVLCTVGKLHEKLEIPIEHHHFGTLVDERLMAMVYNTADVFVHPAIEDNLPNVILESLACGTPVAGFQIGGMPEMIEPGQNGMLATQPDGKLLTGCILEIMEKRPLKDDIARYAHEKYALAVQAERFRELAESLRQ